MAIELQKQGLSGDDNLNGSPWDDLITTGDGTNNIDVTQGGNDTIQGSSGSDYITAGNGNNLVFANSRADVASAVNDSTWEIAA